MSKLNELISDLTYDIGMIRDSVLHDDEPYEINDVLQVIDNITDLIYAYIGIEDEEVLL